MLAGKRAAVLAAVLAYMSLRKRANFPEEKPRAVSAWRLGRVLDVADPVSP